MPFCPNCRDEFEDWVDTCPNCRVPLVDELSALPKPASQTDVIVYVATAPNEQIAYMWAGILEDNGIYCLLKTANLRAAMYSLLLNQYCAIYVLESSASRAKEILSPFEDSLRAYARSRGNRIPVTSRISITIAHILWFVTRITGWS